MKLSLEGTPTEIWQLLRSLQGPQAAYATEPRDDLGARVDDLNTEVIAVGEHLGGRVMELEHRLTLCNHPLDNGYGTTSPCAMRRMDTETGPACASDGCPLRQATPEKTNPVQLYQQLRVPSWQPDTDYSTDVIVHHGDCFCACIVAHRSASTYASGFWVIVTDDALPENPPGPNGVPYWLPHLTYRGAVSVDYKGSIWQRASDHALGAPSEATGWTFIRPALTELQLEQIEPDHVWMPAALYAAGCAVNYDGAPMIATFSNGFVPGEVPGAWIPHTSTEDP